MSLAHIPGYPRIGAHRELKFALESFWRGDSNEQQLQELAASLRLRHWQSQANAGLDLVTVGDFAYYDHVLQTLALLGAIPERFGFDPASLNLQQYSELARGNSQQFAMEMTKWFDTNYHYLVPEWSQHTRFDGGTNWLFDEVSQAQAAGFQPKVVLLGPLSLLALGKVKSGLSHALELLPQLLSAYQGILQRLQQQGVSWVQIDEPVLSLDLDAAYLAQFLPCYQALSQQAPKILLASYFGDVSQHLDLLQSLPVAGVHLDLVRGTTLTTDVLANWPAPQVLSLGVVDGRNIWRTDLRSVLHKLQPVHAALGERCWISSSCSLLHVPVDLDSETRLDIELKNWLAFANQKITEIQTLRLALDQGEAAVAEQLAASDQAVQSRQSSKRIHNPLIQKRLQAIAAKDTQRHSGFSERIRAQQEKWQLPLFPTTTIGSFPQTPAIRQTRAAYKRAEISHLDYLEKMRAEISLVVSKQEELGLDVLVHGEPERNDMVEYFGEQLWGYGFTDFGWVQSYGSRCVKPPFIYGDVYRPEAMTVSWSAYAQSLTDKPMKGMLTGPVTMLQWSFVRDDQPREVTARQIALALRDEVCDLEQAGIGMIQIDEPAFREGLPLRQQDWAHYLDWAVQAFQLCAAGVRDTTQIHTHMCYSEFNDILPWIAAMDADVITIETSRSDMELLDGFSSFSYPNDIGPGVYDIHSPRVPKPEEIARLLGKARSVIPDARLWVNPDCGLKTRQWQETELALANMVAAARQLRLLAEQAEQDQQASATVDSAAQPV
ncbi:5-methyltetrahydropteroyltriglutamate--homocysteine S-methyltransferase [Undibacterium curvum]|uniref:5-methyltetrahydropteroyltriglutamate--homocysteine methyltransferase n=1 Tax=Undibacterium curvum TaxID=2762294 RepID=A0ABR7A9A9_9BURK|nr:5-methyltetrahydropteroyltriglutamate--homocysteine S-methyltransferase [Undibacterium curvum]MBC3933498.1 5-methyltetrahydropteroyltriglutamate--homocysteine S-methyltransferase [Undibacterium curvum]